MNKREHLLITLMEECAEVQKSCSKILRFGEDEDKLMSLNEEVNDVMAVVDLIYNEGLIDVADDEIIQKQQTKIANYMFQADPIKEESKLKLDFESAVYILKRLENHLKVEDGLELNPGQKVKSYPNKSVKTIMRRFLKEHG